MTELPSSGPRDMPRKKIIFCFSLSLMKHHLGEQ